MNITQLIGMNMMDWTLPVSLIRWILSLGHKGLDFLQPEHRLVRRIIRACSAHGIARTQICRVFPDHQLTPTCFSSINDAKQVITADLITDIANTLNINRDWLEGTNSVVANVEITYPYLPLIRHQIDRVKLMESDIEFRFLELVIPTETNLNCFDTHGSDLPIAIAFRTSHEREGIDFNSYHGNEVLYWDNQRPRIHLRAILELSDQANFQIRGCSAPAKYISDFHEGTICFEELLRHCKSVFDPWNKIVKSSSDGEKQLLAEYFAANKPSR